MGGKRGLFLPSKATFHRHFPLEPQFCITVYKALGRTLPRVILAVDEREGKKCNLEYCALYVALSRVEKRENMRLLRLSCCNNQKLRYIYSLTPDPIIEQFFAGFVGNHDGEGSKWDPKLAVNRRYGA